MYESTVIESYGAIIVSTKSLNQYLTLGFLYGPIVNVQQTHSHQSIGTNVRLYNNC